MRKPVAIAVAGLVVLLGVGVPSATATAAPAGTYAAAAAKLKLSKTSYQTKHKSDTVSVKVKTNNKAAWSVQSSPSWVVVSPSSGTGTTKVTVAINDNKVPPSGDTSLARSGVVVFSSGGQTASFSINQLAEPYVYTNPVGDWYVPWGGGSQTVSFDLRGLATAPSCQLKTGDGWLSLSNYSYNPASGTGTVTLTADQNIGKSRNSNVKFQCGTVDRKLKVEQATGPYLDLNIRNLIIGSNGGPARIKVNSLNAPWTAQVVSGGNWYTVSDTSGLSTATITVTVQPNLTGVERVGTVNFQNAYGRVTLTVTQLNHTFELTPENVYDGGVRSTIANIFLMLALR